MVCLVLEKGATAYLKALLEDKHVKTQIKAWTVGDMEVWKTALEISDWDKVYDLIYRGGQHATNCHIDRLSEVLNILLDKENKYKC